MPKYMAPGVYVEETPGGVRTIEGVPTSITAFVGRASRGAVGTPVRVTSFAEFQAGFGEVWKQSMLGHAVRQFFAHGGAEAFVVRVLHAQAGGDPEEAVARVAGAVVGAAGELTLAAADEGSWGNWLSVTIDVVPGAGGAAGGIRFDLSVADDGTGTQESFADLAADPNDVRFVTDVLKQKSKLVRVSDLTGPPTGASTKDIPFAGGGDGAPPTVEDVLGDPDRRTGLRALDDVDLFNLLCIPPLLDEDLAEIDARALWPVAAQYCAERRAFLLVDPPAAWRSYKDARGGIRALVAGIGHGANAALHFPRLVTDDPAAKNRTREVAPGGAIAGVIARTDARRGVWKTFAGTEATLVDVVDLSCPLDDAQRDILSQLAINSLRDLPGIGHVVWGARTLEGAVGSASEWKYVPVRRLALYIEESLYRGTRWAVFEPNDEPLWAQIRQNVGAFLHGLFRQGAFQGSTPEDAYFVKCDAETMTPSDIAQGIVDFQVGIAPLKPAEFVVLRIRHCVDAVEDERVGGERHLPPSGGGQPDDAQAILYTLGRRIDPRAGWDDLVLPARPLQLLRAMSEEIGHRLEPRDDRSLGALFTGPSGTGKTLAAEVIAGALGVSLYRVDLAALVGKYIGETEKNLQRLFAAAEATGAVLLFDEADALFGKRTEVREAHDRYANLELSYLLQRIEEFGGIVILSTNRRENLDEAFTRRLRHVVRFPFPSPAARRRIWQRVFPAAAPLAKLDFTALAESELSGRNIRDVALRAAFLAAARKGKVTQELVLEAVRTEFARTRRRPDEREAPPPS